MSPTEDEYKVLLRATYRQLGYVITGFDEQGIAGFSSTNETFNMTWDEAASRLITMLIERGS